MGSKLYVGNLSFAVTNTDLQELFAPHGTPVSAQVITERDTGRSKGFGFVEMSSNAEAQAAITALNGQQNDGRPLTVNEAKPRENRAVGSDNVHRSLAGASRNGYGGNR